MKLLRGLSALALLFIPPAIQAGVWDELFGPDNYWECLLEKMPETQTYGGSMEHLSQCASRFPDQNDYQTGGGWFGPDTLEECLQEYRTETNEALARLSIRKACFRLFPPN